MGFKQTEGQAKKGSQKSGCHMEAGNCNQEATEEEQVTHTKTEAEMALVEEQWQRGRMTTEREESEDS